MPTFVCMNKMDFQIGKWAVLLVFAFAMFACQNNTTTESTSEKTQHSTSATTEVKESTSSKVVTGTTQDLKFDGEYRTVLPCSDCVGVKTKIILDSDGTYQLYELFIGKNEEPQVSAGNYVVSDGKFEIKGSKNTLRLGIGKGVLHVLDESGHIKEGEAYVLKY